MTAYTHVEKTIADHILVACRVAILDTDINSVPAVKALWDTGATCTCVSEDLVKTLGLQPEDSQIIKGANNQPFSVPVYSVQLKMGHFVIPYLRVCALPMEGNEHDVIIGMDVMSKGDLSITNYEGQTVFTFREPSIARVDYVQELKNYELKHKAWIKSGNDKCPCGSGKKYKNCHGR